MTIVKPFYYLLEHADFAVMLARTAMTRERGREIQRLEKLLEDAGIKLSSVASDIPACPAG